MAQVEMAQPLSRFVNRQRNGLPGASHGGAFKLYGHFVIICLALPILAL
jgi:hypothetical protein